jgi:hypothetical protein
VKEIAVSLKAGHAQARKAMSFKCALPGKELLLREMVTTAGFHRCYFLVTHSSQNRGFTPDRPSFGVRRRQLNVHPFRRQRVARQPEPAGLRVFDVLKLGDLQETLSRATVQRGENPVPYCVLPFSARAAY